MKLRITRPVANRPTMDTRANTMVSNTQLVSAKETLTTSKSRCRRSPLQALWKLTNAVLDVKTGKLLGYR